MYKGAMDERLDALEAGVNALTANIENHARRIERLRAFFEESLPKLDHGSLPKLDHGHEGGHAHGDEIAEN